MAERTTAEERLARILYLLPAAGGEEGASLNELARTLHVDVETVLDDIEAVTERSWYHPPGGADDLQITLTRDRVRVWTKGAFQRPVRLSPRETLCLALGLRVLGVAARGGGARGGDGGATGPPASPVAGAEVGGAAAEPAGSDLRDRLEAALAVAAARDETPVIHAPELEADPDDARGALLEATRTRRACRIRYLKPDAPAPEERTVHPYVVAYAEGEWYAIGEAPEAGDVRVFRLDRVLAAELVQPSETFEVPEDFDPSRYVARGRVYFATGNAQARIRYSPRVARWIAEREEVEPDARGWVYVRHAVSDPRWLVRHVLRYGPDAEVVEPEEVRAMVGEVAEGMAG